MIENPIRSMYSVRKMTPSDSLRGDEGADVDTRKGAKPVAPGPPSGKRRAA
jgi:hypothetical protein